MHFLFYKNTLYKNTKARFAQKIRTRLKHAQLQMRYLGKPIRISKFTADIKHSLDIQQSQHSLGKNNFNDFVYKH